MTPNLVKLVEAAETVVDELAANGHDITVLDVLDVLASTGYTLAEDVSGSTREAYVSLLTK